MHGRWSVAPLHTRQGNLCSTPIYPSLVWKWTVKPCAAIMPLTAPRVAAPGQNFWEPCTTDPTGATKWHGWRAARREWIRPLQHLTRRFNRLHMPPLQNLVAYTDKCCAHIQQINSDCQPLLAKVSEVSNTVIYTMFYLQTISGYFRWHSLWKALI